MRNQPFQRYQLFLIVLCAILLFIPIVDAHAQDAGNSAIYLPIISGGENGNGSEVAATPTPPPASTGDIEAPDSGEAIMPPLQGAYPPPPADATQRDEMGTPLVAEAVMPTEYSVVRSTTGPLDMTAGRLTKTPASVLYNWEWFFTTTFRVRVICASEPCDTGLLVVVNGRAWYNDDDPETMGKGSYICVTCDEPALQNTNAMIYVFSQQRHSSEAVLYVDSGFGWVKATQRHFGGTVIKVGPLRQGDFLEVQADQRQNSTLPFDNNDTHMVLFNPNRLSNGVIYNNNRAARDWNPRIDVPNQNWLTPDNYVVLGKTGVSTNSPLGVEARVDLVRGPLNRDRQQAAFPVNGGPGSPLWLEPGRYYGYLYAMTGSPVGHGQFNLANVMPSDKCDNRDGITYYRGQLNALAFKLFVQQGRVRSDGSLGWRDVAQRDIPLAALGTIKGGRNLFLMEIVVDEAAYYRLETFRPAGWFQDISYLNRWEVKRNPDASELRVATFNTLYDGNDYQVDKMRNTADLLATNGNIDSANGAVIARADQVAWQWDADVIGLQEVKKYILPTPTPTVSPTPTPYSPVPPSPTLVPLWERFGLAEILVEEAERVGSVQWSYVKGRDEDFEDYIVYKAESGLGPLFVSENAWPGGSETGIYFGPQAKAQAQCRDFNQLDYAECQLEGDGGIRAAYNFTVPGKAAARRYGSSHDRAIAVFNLHLEFESDKLLPMGETAHHRWKEVDALIETMDNLLAVEPDAFNAAVGDANRTTPQHWQNRMIIMGDFNMNAHACGEHYWILEKLRQHYGYAVDLSMLALANGDDMAMHDRMGDMSQWQSAGDWRNAPDTSSSSRYPWWASSYRGKTAERFNKDERYDAVFLVGKGWSFDDPFLEYKVLSDRDDPSPMHPNGGGVEMWASDPGIVSNSGTNYRPIWDLGYGIGPGTPALHTDHLPVLARLRIFYH